MSDRAGLIATGCAAARSGSWREAFDALEAADVVEPLEADELEVLGWAAHFSARPEAAIAVRQRAFASVRDADPTRAALIALHIALVQLGRDALAVGTGWVQQATNLLARSR